MHVRLEREFVERYEILKQMAASEAAIEVRTVEPETQANTVEAVPEDDPTCTLTGTAEHSSATTGDEACDDGRAGT